MDEIATAKLCGRETHNMRDFIHVSFESENTLGSAETSESAVKSTIQRLFTKLGARTRSQLVRIAIEKLGNQFHVGPPARAAAADQKILSK